MCNKCDAGWKGKYCEVMEADSNTINRVNRNKRKDYTKDGLYKPQSISEQKVGKQDSSSSRSGNKPRKIDSEESTSSSSRSSAASVVTTSFTD